VALDAATVEEAVAELAPVLYVFKRGRMTVPRERAKLHRPQ
jgi:cytosine deaminase